MVSTADYPPLGICLGVYGVWLFLMAIGVFGIVGSALLLAALNSEDDSSSCYEADDTFSIQTLCVIVLIFASMQTFGSYCMCILNGAPWYWNWDDKSIFELAFVCIHEPDWKLMTVNCCLLIKEILVVITFILFFGDNKDCHGKLRSVFAMWIIMLICSFGIFVFVIGSVIWYCGNFICEGKRGHYR